MEPVSSSRDVENRRTRVLIVEDDVVIRWQAAEYLRDAGYHVIEAANVNEGIVVFSSGTQVDIVFSDINLAGELTGHALARWLSKFYPEVPMLLTSGDQNASASISAGGTRSFVAKPYDLAEVDRRIKQLLSRQ
jgi:DNA-binding NtrC family response regulator